MIQYKSLLLRIIPKLSRNTQLEAVWAFGAKGITFFFFYAINLYLARTLGVEIFGQWSFLFSLFTILFTLSHLGINRSIRIYVAREKPTNHINTVVISGFLLRITTSIILAAVIYFLAPHIALFLQIPQHTHLLRLAIPMVFATTISQWSISLFVGWQQNKYQLFTIATEFILKFILIVILTTASTDFINLIHAHNVSHLLAAIIGIILIIHLLPHPHINQFSLTWFKKIAVLSLPLFFIDISTIILTEIDVLMLGMLTNNYEVGIYSAAKQITSKLPHLAFTLNMIFMPAFASLNSHNRAYLRNRFFKLIKYNLLLYTTLCMLLISLSPWLVPLLLGADYAHSVLPLQILTVYVFLISINTFFNELMDYQQQVTTRSLFMATTVIANVTLNLILIPRYGSTGAAVSTVLSVIPFIVLNVNQSLKILKP